MDGSTPASSYPEEFEQQVRNCLTHLYDITQLQQFPLVRQLLPDTPALQRGQAFRRLIFNLLEAMETGGGEKQDRVCQILMLRYIEGRPNHEVSQQLALSERQYYREHNRALQAITYLLWEEVKALEEPFSPEISVQSELQRASGNVEYAAVDTASLCARAIESTSSLANARHIQVDVNLPEQSPEISLNANAVRQLLIMFLYQAIQRHTAGEPLHITCEPSPTALTIQLRFIGPEQRELQQGLEQHQAFQELLRTLNGRLDYQSAGRQVLDIRLHLPIEQNNLVLIIDDNPDATSLLQRYLSSTFQSVVARQGEEGISMARALKPWLIILDVMLPTVDGWEVLQNLKNHPDTHDIPVLVCSVLDTPDMALALGADGFLKKPPDRIEFLTTLSRWRASIPRPPHPHS